MTEKTPQYLKVSLNVLMEKLLYSIINWKDKEIMIEYGTLKKLEYNANNFAGQTVSSSQARGKKSEIKKALSEF